MKVRSRRTRRVALAGVLGVLLFALTAGEARGSPEWSWPVEGGVLTPYSNDDSNAYAGGVHRGIDIAAASGTPVEAARAGAVVYAGALGYSGITVSVRTVDGYVTSYLHLSAVSVRRGETIAGGTVLGKVGTTGRRSKPEPHLHFGVRVAGEKHRYVDPLTLLPPLPGQGAAAPAAPAPVPAKVAPRPEPARVIAARPRPAVVHRPAPRPGRHPVHLPLPALAPAPVAPARVPRPTHHAHRPHGLAHAPAAAPRAQQAAPDWGRPLALGGLALLALALFGRAAIRGAGNANRAVSRRAWAAIGRAVRPARAYLPRWR